MAYNISSGEVCNRSLYEVTGEQSVIYNFVTYAPGQSFRGIQNVSQFTFVGSGVQKVTDLSELRGGSIEYHSDADAPIASVAFVLESSAIEFELNEAEKIVNDVTLLKGFGLELIDYPFYSFQITENIL